MAWSSSLGWRQADARSGPPPRPPTSPPPSPLVQAPGMAQEEELPKITVGVCGERARPGPPSPARLHACQRVWGWACLPACLRMLLGAHCLSAQPVAAAAVPPSPAHLSLTHSTPPAQPAAAAMDKKARSKQMTSIVNRLLRFGEFEVVFFGDDVILDKPGARSSMRGGGGEGREGGAGGDGGAGRRRAAACPPPSLYPPTLTPPQWRSGRWCSACWPGTLRTFLSRRLSSTPRCAAPTW